MNHEWLAINYGNCNICNITGAWICKNCGAGDCPQCQLNESVCE